MEKLIEKLSVMQTLLVFIYLFIYSLCQSSTRLEIDWTDSRSLKSCRNWYARMINCKKSLLILLINILCLMGHHQCRFFSLPVNQWKPFSSVMFCLLQKSFFVWL